MRCGSPFRHKALSRFGFVIGRKRWRLWPPECALLLRDRWGGAAFAPWPPCVGDGLSVNLPCSSATNPASSSSVLYPFARHAACLEFIQSAGTAVFVPSGWAHTVENLDDALSMSCNWANAINVARVSRSVSFGACEGGDCSQHSQDNALQSVLRFVAERELAALAAYEAASASDTVAEEPSRGAVVARLMSLLAVHRIERALRMEGRSARDDETDALRERCRSALEIAGYAPHP